MEKNSKILVAGYKGLVGSALVRRLHKAGHNNLLLADRQELDFLNQNAVNSFFETQNIEYAIIAAARVGGIYANSNLQADFLYENLMIAANIIHAASKNNVKKLLFLGSSCIYPKAAPQPLREESLLSSYLEPSNEGYAIAKIAGLKLCEMYRRQYNKNFISAMPTNLYGPGDNFHPMNSHVIPGMIRKFHDAKAGNAKDVVLWGTGTPKREFLHVDDLADALCLLMEKYESPAPINIGTGEECTIKELAQLIQEVTGFNGKIRFDESKPDGVMRKIVESSKITALGWKSAHDLKSGLQSTYKWALENKVFDRA